MMHEAARHAIHSFETLSVSVETVEAIAMQQHFLYLAGKSKQPSRGGPEASYRLRMHIDTQARMLRNLLLRSQSNKERPQNETALVGDSVGRGHMDADSRSGVQHDRPARQPGHDGAGRGSEA
jgi:hypothetical protein